MLQMKEVLTSRISVIMVDGFLQNAGVGWRGDCALRYHLYAIPEGTDLYVAAAFVCGISFGHKIRLLDPDVGEDEESEE